LPEEVSVALRIRFVGPTGSTLGYAIERLSDSSLYDFSTGQFTSGTPVQTFQSLPEDTPTFPGLYRTNLTPTPTAQFTNGDYLITVIDQAANLCVGVMTAVLSGGDDTTVIPGGPVASVTAPVTVGTNNDKTGYSLTQAFPANFASLAIDSSGRITVGTNNDKTGYSLTQAFPANFASLAIDSSGRMTAGSVADKTGYALASAGLDAVVVEPGINARQALSPILAAAAGVVTGAGTGTIVFQAANSSTTRIVATTDNAGNRLSVVLSLPS
jgi:hypothetical protein